MSSEEGGEWSYSESKDWKDGRHRRGNEFVFSHAGEVGDRETRETLTALKMAYERAYSRGWIDSDWPAEFEKTETYRRIRSHADTEAFAKRTHEQPHKLRAHIGSQSDDIDVSGWQAIEKVREIITEQHLRLYIYGEPDTGKTSTGCLIGRHWLDERVNNGFDPAIYSNIRTLESEHDAITWVSDWPQLKGEIEKHRQLSEGPSEPFLFLFDEASSQAAGRGKQGYEAGTKLASLVYKIRKYGGALVIIGHDGKDVVPSVRELCKVLHKETQKSARLYDKINNREGEEPITEELTGWPDSKWSPNQYDPAGWQWSSPDDDGEEEIEERDVAVYLAVRLREAGVSTSETAESVGYSTGWVSSRFSGYQDGEQEKQTVERISELME